MTLLKFIENRMKFLDGIQSSCQNQEIKEKTEHDVVKSIQEKISKSPKTCVGESVLIIDIISNHGLSIDNKSKLIEAIGTLTITGEMAKPEENNERQSHDYMENYFTMNEWKDLAGSEVETVEKIKIIARAILRCGWYSHSEPQLANVVAILTTLGFAEIGADSLKILQDLKSLLQKMLLKKN